MPKLKKPDFERPPLVVDIETKEPDIDRFGAGLYAFPRSEAYILGVGIYDPETGYKDYLTLDHPNTDSELGRVKCLLETDRDKLLANAAYDLDWLINGYGIKVGGFIHDIQIAAPLLDPYLKSFRLDTLAQLYDIPGKQTVDIERWADKICPNRSKLKTSDRAAQKFLHLMPWDVVGEYCIGDLEATYEVYRRQLQQLKAEDLLDVYELECQLVWIRLMMRKNGVRIDQKKRSAAIQAVLSEETELYDNLQIQYGMFNLNSTKQIAPILQRIGLNVEYTEKGNPSVGKEWLAKQEHPFCKDLLRVRAINKLRTSFLEKSIDEHLCPDGRIHGQFHQLRGDESGTITGRWSSTDPNLQQIPRNDKKLGALARGMFVPSEGCWYGHTDYSQVEYRVFSHYARGWQDGDALDKGAQAMRQKFLVNPKTDYHQAVIDLVQELTGVTLDRPTAKRVNFGVLYSMGPKSMSKKFNIPLQEAEEVFDALLTALPFIESTRTRVVNQAKLKGAIRTILRRKQRVGLQHLAKDHWGTYIRQQYNPHNYMALHRVPQVGESKYDDRDKYYPFFNYLIQGSAADIAKKALLDCYESGCYDVLELYLIVHDETGTGIPQTVEGYEAYQEQQYLMGNAVKLKVPIIADADYGLDWGTMIAEGDDCFPSMAKALGIPDKRIYV